MLSVNLKQRRCSGVNLAESGRSSVLRILRPLFWMTRGSIYRCWRLVFRPKWGETSSGTSGGPHGRNLEIRAHFGIDSTLGSNRSRNHPIELKFGVNILHHVFKLLWKFHGIWTCRTRDMIDSMLHFWRTWILRIDLSSNRFGRLDACCDVARASRIDPLLSPVWSSRLEDSSALTQWIRRRH